MSDLSKLNIYVASSWRNLLQPGIVVALRKMGCENVYDFRNPSPNSSGFSWKNIDQNWKNWTADEYRQALHHPIAKEGYHYDIEALKACNVCVLVLPSGRSASWEAGFAFGQGKRLIVVQFDKEEPELMYSGAEIVTNMDELFACFGYKG